MAGVELSAGIGRQRTARSVEKDFKRAVCYQTALFVCTQALLFPAALKEQGNTFFIALNKIPRELSTAAHTLQPETGSIKGSHPAFYFGRALGGSFYE